MAIAGPAAGWLSYKVTQGACHSKLSLRRQTSKRCLQSVYLWHAGSYGVIEPGSPELQVYMSRLEEQQRAILAAMPGGDTSLCEILRVLEDPDARSQG